MKKALSLILVLIMALSLTACGERTPNGVVTETDEVSETVEPIVEEKKPLSGASNPGAADAYLNIFNQNNVQTGATFLAHNGWLYGQAWDNYGASQFIKVRSDGTDWTVLDKGMAHHIYVVDNYIYYMLMSEAEHGIYKMKTSGEDRQKLSDAHGSMQIVGKQIYYSDYDCEYEYDELGNISRTLPEYAHLYRCDLDGNNVTEIIAKPTFCFYVFEDGILYQDDNDNMSLHVCNIDGTEDIKINNEHSYNPIYDGEYIYYTTDIITEGSISNRLCKIKPDGTAKQMLADFSVGVEFVMSEDKIFFIFADDSDRLYRVDKDGSNLTLITQDTHIRFPQLFEGAIKYTKYTDDYVYIEGNFFCEYDGSGKENFLDLFYY